MEAAASFASHRLAALAACEKTGRVSRTVRPEGPPTVRPPRPSDAATEASAASTMLPPFSVSGSGPMSSPSPSKSDAVTV